MKTPHRIALMIRDLRKAAGVSLSAFEAKSGLKAVVVGSYERGDRTLAVARADEILGWFGYELRAVPFGSQVIPPNSTVYTLTSDQMVAQLHLIASQLEHGGGEPA